MGFEPSSCSRVALGEVVEFTGAFDPELQLEIRTFSDVGRVPSPAEVTIVMPIHDQIGIITNNLTALESCLTLNAELFLILDHCTDGSDEAVLDWVQSSHSEMITRMVVVQTETDIFETMCDAVGFTLSEAPIVIEVQADMHLEMQGFDSLFADALNGNDDVFLLSGRGAHDFLLAMPQLKNFPSRLRRRVGTLFGSNRRKTSTHYSARLAEFFLTPCIGRVGSNIERPSADLKARRLFLHQTVMRGPLGFRREKYARVGGLDTSRFFLGDDDHDLALRGLLRFGWQSAYMPVTFSSPLETGSTRKQRTSEEIERLEFLKGFYSEAGSTSPLRTTTKVPVKGRRVRSVRDAPTF